MGDSLGKGGKGASRVDGHVALPPVSAVPFHLSRNSSPLLPYPVNDGKLYGKERQLLWWLLGAGMQQLALPTINTCYGGKDEEGRIGLCSMMVELSFLSDRTKLVLQSPNHTRS
jgi:hypothetical protein